MLFSVLVVFSSQISKEKAKTWNAKFRFYQNHPLLFLLVIDDGSSIAIQRGHAPDQEGDLAEPVEGNPASDEVSEVFDDRESSEDHPVGEPLGVVRFALGLQSFNGAVGRVGKPDNFNSCSQIHQKVWELTQSYWQEVELQIQKQAM